MTVSWPCQPYILNTLGYQQTGCSCPVSSFHRRPLSSRGWPPTFMVRVGYKMRTVNTRARWRGCCRIKDYAEAFYKSRAWRNCRNEYAKSVGGLCELCLAKGRYTAGEIVHHKEHISPENITDPAILLSWDNLQLLCRECHAAQHSRRKRRYKLDDMGRVKCV